jgi:hypothetical protein
MEINYQKNRQLNNEDISPSALFQLTISYLSLSLFPSFPTPIFFLYAAEREERNSPSSVTINKPRFSVSRFAINTLIRCSHFSRSSGEAFFAQDSNSSM